MREALLAESWLQPTVTNENSDVLKEGISQVQPDGCHELRLHGQDFIPHYCL
jgi:hypothetical protein